MQNHYLAPKFSFFIALLTAFFSPPMVAQVIIKTASTPDIVVCQSAEKLEVEITANATFTEPLTVQIQLPPGISYVPQSLENVDSPVGLEILEEDILELAAPIFQISASSSNPFTDGESLTFQIEREADCMSIVYAQAGGTFEDNIVVNFGGGSEEELSVPYNVLFASLAVFIPNSESGPSIVGTTIEREISIINGGLACTDSIRYILEFDDTRAKIEQISMSGVSLPFDLTTEGVTVDIYNDFLLLVGNGNTCLEDNETLVLKMQIRLDACKSGNLELKHQVFWGCKEEECNTSESKTNKINVASSSSLNIVNRTAYINWLSACKNGTYRGYVTNLDNQAAYNLFLEMGWGDKFHQVFGVGLVNIQVNEMDFPFNGDAAQMLDFRENTLQNIGLVDADGDGFHDDLLPEDTLFFSLDMEYQCGFTDFPKRNFYTKISYQTGCGINRFKLQKSNLELERQIITNRIRGATDIWNDGQDYTFRFCTEGNQNFICPDNLAELKIYAPFSLGLVPVRAYLNDNTPLTIETVSDELIAIGGIKGIEVECVQVDFQLDCACFQTPRYFDLNWEYDYTCEEGCNCIETLFEGEYEVFNHCWYTSIEDCAEEGVVIIDRGEGDFEGCLMTVSMEAERASLGWTDFTFTEQVAANNEGLRLDLALPCDSIRIEADGIAISTLADNAYVRVIYDGIYDSEVLAFSSGTVHYVDRETGQKYNCPINASKANNSLVQFRNDPVQAIDIDLTETLGNCYPKTRFSPLDSINFEGYFRVLDDNFSPNDFLLNRELERFRTFHYWINGEGKELNCDHIGDRMYLNTYQIRLEERFESLRSCDTGKAKLEFVFEGGRFNDLFPNEVRPSMLVDSIRVEMPSAFEYKMGSADFQYLPLDRASIPDPSILTLNGGQTQLTFVNDGTWGLGDKISSEQIAGGLHFEFINPCKRSGDLEYTYYYHENYYSNDSDCLEAVSKSQSSSLSVGNLYVRINSINYENEGTARKNNITVRICNNSNLSVVSPYLFLQHHFDNDIKILEITAEDSNVEFQQTQLEDESILLTFEDTNLQQGNCIDLILKTEYIDCVGTNIRRVYSGYVCDDVYPPAAIEINCPVQDQYLSFDTQPAEVQLQVNGPTDPIPLCEAFTYEFTINSAQLANIYEPILDIEFPPLGGLSLEGNPTIEYPIGTGERSFTPIFTSNGIQLDLAAADLETAPSSNIAENGIHGLDLGTSNTRKAIVRLPLITDCNFISGSSLRSTITANRPCGSPATGSGITQLLEPILIEGAVPSYITLTTINSEAVSYCEGSSTVKVQIINEGPAATSADEHCYIFLPANTHYLEGSTESLSENIVAEPHQNDQNSLIQLDFTMPPNVAENDTIAFTFEVDVSEFAVCEDAFIEFIAQTIEFVPLLCVSENATCDLPVKTSEGAGYFDITIGGPEMSLSAIANTGCSPEKDDELSIQMSISNNGNKAVLTEYIAVDVYLDTNGNGIVDATEILLDSLVYSEILEVGETVSLNGIWTVDPSLLVSVILVLEEEDYCRGCEDVSFWIPEIEPISALHLESELECDDDTETYSVYVYMLDGVPPYFISGGVSANMNIDNFWMPNIPYGASVEFFIEDGVGCKDSLFIDDLCSVTLPVELLYFDGEILEEGNLLQWATASELNNDYFRLERSIDGQTFEKWAVIEGNGTTNVTQEYAYWDENPSNGVTYYRLLQIDLDSKVKKLKTIALERKNEISQLLIQSANPIPATDFFHLQYQSPTAQNLTLEVFNINQQPVYQKTLEASVGMNDWRVDCGDWRSGVYILQLSSEEERVFEKVVLQ